MSQVTREKALKLLQKYNEEPFHILHGLTVEGVMRYFAAELGYGTDVDFWGLCGLLHDVDFEKYPEEHCKKAPELLAEIDASDEMVHQHDVVLDVLDKLGASDRPTIDVINKIDLMEGKMMWPGALPISAKDVLRAAVLRNMLVQVFRNIEGGDRK